MNAPEQTPRHRIAVAVIAVLWLGAVIAFIATAARGATAFHLGQAVSGLCVIAAGVIVAVDWLGVATAMGRQRARRWSGRVEAPEASDPTVATRSTRLLAWWWIGFGVLILILAIASPR